MLDRLATPIPNFVKFRLNHLLILMYSKVENCWSRLDRSFRIYSSSSAYGWLRSRNHSDYVNFGQSWIWKLWIPEKVKFLIWLNLHGALRTNSLHFARHLAVDPFCFRCFSQVESPLHCLKDYSYSKDIWLKLGFGVLPLFFNLEGLVANVLEAEL